MRNVMFGLLVLPFVLYGQAAWANNPIDEYSSHRPIRMLEDSVVCLSEHAMSMHQDCIEISEYEWCDTSYWQPMMAAGAAGSSWDHFQSAFVFQEHVDAMNSAVDDMDSLCQHLLAQPPDNWLILPQALDKVRLISGYVPDLRAQLDDIQFWLDQTFPHRDYQQIQVACERIEQMECRLHETIECLAEITCTDLTSH